MKGRSHGRQACRVLRLACWRDRNYRVSVWVRRKGGGGQQYSCTLTLASSAEENCTNAKVFLSFLLLIMGGLRSCSGRKRKRKEQVRQAFRMMKRQKRLGMKHIFSEKLEE